MRNSSRDTKSRQKIKLERTIKIGDPPVYSASQSTSFLALHWLLPTLIAVITFVVFLPTLQNGFVNWDDEAHLVENPHYRGLGWEQLRWMFTTCFQGSCMPLNWVTYGLDYVLWGMNPSGYHLTSLLVHVVNAVVFYCLSLRLLRLGLGASDVLSNVPIRLAASFSALIFSIHPLQVEVVAWATGREIAIAGFFFFLTLICYLKAAESEPSAKSHRRWMGASWLFYAMSLLGKEAALTLPFALIVVDVYPLRRLGSGQGKWFGSQVRRLWWEKLPFLILAVAAAIRGALEKERAGSFYPVTGYGLLPRLAQVLYSLAFYPWKTLFPTALSPLYPVRPFTGLWSPPVLLSSALVLSLSVGFFVARRRWPAGLAAWCFYALLLLPVSGVVPFGPYIAADRFSYLPSLGWPVLAGAGLFYCWRLWVSGRIGHRTMVLTQSLAVLVLIGLGTLAWRQTQIWHDSETLWRHALAVEEDSSFAHNNLGLVLAQRGALQEAIKEFRRAVEIDPFFVEAYTNLGNFLAQRGSRDEATVQLRRALEIDPGFVKARNTLANILVDKGDLDQAIAHLRKALETNPQFAMTHYNLGRALAKHGDMDEAMTQYRQAIQIDPGDAESHNNLGLLLLNRGDIGQATEQFRYAIEANPNYARAYFNLGTLYAHQNRLDDAVQNFQQALKIQPEIAEIHENLARALAAQGKKSEALQEYQEAVRLLRLRTESRAAGK